MDRRDGRQVQRVDLPDNILSSVLEGATRFVKKNKTISTSYLIGMLLLVFGTGFKVSETLRTEYDVTLSQIDYEAQKTAHAQMWQSKQQYESARGWFSCDANCQRLQNRFKQHELNFNNLKLQEAAVTKAAKSKLGIMSEYGVQETRDLFWGTFAGGKNFAKRQSMWDLLFTGLRWGKDEELFSVVLRWLVQLLFNFTLGLVGALVVFVFKLWGVVAAYSPDPITGLVYFLLAAASATACVATYLAVLYGAAAGSVVVVAKAVVDSKHRIAHDQSQQRQRMQYGGGGGQGVYGGGSGGGYAGSSGRGSAREAPAGFRYESDHID
jgi:hypothetical protein